MGMDDYGDEDEVLLFIAQVIVAVKTFAKGPFLVTVCPRLCVCLGLARLDGQDQ